MPNLILFYLFAAVAVVSTVLVIAQSNPVYSVLLLIASFMSLAGLYVLLDAPFVAVTQIIVYAGAIMVLFLFVVMLLNVREEAREAGALGYDAAGARVFGTTLAVLLAIELVWALNQTRALGGVSRGDGAGSWPVGEIGRVLFRNYGFAFEATSILILIAMVGAIVLAGPSQEPDGKALTSAPDSQPRTGSVAVAGLNHYLVLSGLLFAIGTLGVFLRRNLITMLLSIEVMLNAVNLSFVAFGRFLESIDGQIIVFFVITVAAAEAAVGLAIVIALFRDTQTLNPDAFRELKG